MASPEGFAAHTRHPPTLLLWRYLLGCGGVRGSCLGGAGPLRLYLRRVAKRTTPTRRCRSVRGSTPGPLVLVGSEQVAADFAQAGPSWLVLTEAGVAEVGVPSSSSVEAGAVQSGTTAGDPHEPSRYGGTVSKWWRNTGGRLHWVPYGPS